MAVLNPLVGSNEKAALRLACLPRLAGREEELALLGHEQKLFVSLKPGEVRGGVVSTIVNFGAFVDLGGVDGFVPVSELSWKRIQHPSEVVEVGDKVLCV